MNRRRRFPLIRVTILVLAIVTLGVLVMRSRGILPASLSPPNREPTSISTAVPTFNPPLLEATEQTGPPPAARTDTASGSETPADQWANLVLDRALPLLQEGAAAAGVAPADGLAWWRSEGAAQLLTWEGTEVLVGGEPFPEHAPYSIQVSVADPERPIRLEPVGRAAPESGALLLTVGEQTSQEAAERWLLSAGTPLLALRSLAVQAYMRDLSLWITYTQEAGSVIHVVILEARPTGQPTAAPSPEGSQTPTPALTATPTVPVTPTPTRVPDSYLGDIVATKIDPAITDANELSALTTQTFLERHPWAGVLSATERGIQIGGRPSAVGEATELNFYLLQDSGENSGGVSRLFAALYTADATTRFSDEQILFQGHRMEEIVYWIVIHAAERGGQMLVAYDDYGQRQAITIIGFRPFPSSTP